MRGRPSLSVSVPLAEEVIYFPLFPTPIPHRDAFAPFKRWPLVASHRLSCYEHSLRSSFRCTRLAPTQLMHRHLTMKTPTMKVRLLWIHSFCIRATTTTDEAESDVCAATAVRCEGSKHAANPRRVQPLQTSHHRLAKLPVAC